MTCVLVINCDVCDKDAELSYDTDIVQWLAENGWDFDPAVGHRCSKCARQVVTSSDDRLVIESTVAQETVPCNRCDRPVFFGLNRFHGKVPFNAEPHHCGFIVLSCTISPSGSRIHMGNEYFPIGAPAPSPTYSAHKCRKRDLK